MPNIISLAIMIFLIISMWKLFEKAGQPGWASIIPIYNSYIMLIIAGKPGWWIILLLIPGVNLVVAIIAMIALAEKFGQGTGFAIGLVFLPFIFMPILAFGDAQYSSTAAPALAAAEE